MTGAPSKTTRNVLAFALILFAPHVTIWALNTVFALSILHNFSTWFAVLWLSIVTKSTVLPKEETP